MLAPFIPSDTARGGGVVFPITRSRGQRFRSRTGADGEKIGAFLVLVSFHTTYAASAMFLTGMAANPLIAEFARQDRARRTHVGAMAVRLDRPRIPDARRSCRGCCSAWYGPRSSDTAAARAMARQELARRGPHAARRGGWWRSWSGVMAGWVTFAVARRAEHLRRADRPLRAAAGAGDRLGRSAGRARAWDALIWFAPLVMMSEVLNENGTIKVLSQRTVRGDAGWAWPVALTALVTAYCYVHYGFASMTGHVTALYPAFLAATLAAGVPPMMAALALAYFSNLNAAMTHYGTGSAPVFFGAGYVRQGGVVADGF